jgi:DinB superfamily
VQDLQIAFTVAQSQLKVYVEDINRRMAKRVPANGGNPVNWILGHILSERVEALERIGAVIAGMSCQSVTGEMNAAIPEGVPDLSQYVTGTEPNAETFLPFDDLLALIPVTYNALRSSMNSLTNDDLAVIHKTTILGKPPTLGQDLNVYTFHEMYHIGQISAARKAFGL